MKLMEGIRNSPLFTGQQPGPIESTRSLCKTSRTRLKRKFVQKWRQFWLMDTVFSVLNIIIIIIAMTMFMVLSS